MAKGPGKSHRKGISLLTMAKMFPDEAAATKWFEGVMWQGERCCGHCGSVRTTEASHAKMPYWCSDCRSYFSVRTGTIMERSKIPLLKWAWAIYLNCTSLKGVAAMKLHRDIEVSYPTAWFMQHRIREAFAAEGPVVFAGPVEIDETYVGGSAKSMHAAQKKKLKEEHGSISASKAMVVGAKDRKTGKVVARVIDKGDSPMLHGFIESHTDPSATVFTDGASVYKFWFNHESVNHSAGEFVRGIVHTQGVESFWSMLKRAHKGVFHRMSAKHLQRYVDEFSGRHNIRDRDTIDQMRHVVAQMVGKRLKYRDLIAETGESSVAT